MIKRFTADFETCTWLDDETYVWAWAVCDIDNTEYIKIGTDIFDFLCFAEKYNNSKFYFHNLKFDSEFVIYWLLNNGFTWIKEKKDRKDKTFTTLINDMGVFYSVTIYFKANEYVERKITLIDSLKIIPFSVDETAEAFNLPISKLKIDYNAFREIGHRLTKEEEDYIKNDVLIVAEALKVIFSEGLTKNTRAGNAMFDFKHMLGSEDKFRHYFPKLDYRVDEQIRQCYKRRLYLLKPYISRKNCL